MSKSFKFGTVIFSLILIFLTFSMSFAWYQAKVNQGTAINLASEFNRSKSIGQEASLLNLTDLGLNVLGGMGSGIASSGAYALKKLGADDAAKKWADSSSDISDFFAKYASAYQKEAKKAFEFERQILEVDSENKYQDEFEKIKYLPEEQQKEALYLARKNRELRNYGRTIKSAYGTGYAAEAMGTGVGSIGSSAILTRGFNLLGKNLGSALEVSSNNALKAAGSKLMTSANPTVKCVNSTSTNQTCSRINGLSINYAI
jgi:hypothetical protein